MLKRVAFCAAAILVVAGLSLAGQQQKASSSEGSWTGWVTDTQCGAKGANANHADCAAKCVKEKDAKYALYDTKDKKVYILDPQDGAAEHSAHHVKVSGTLDGDTIHVTSYKMIGSKKGASSDSSKSKS